MKLPFFPIAASHMAERVDRLYLGLLLISAFFLALIFLPMLYFLFKYRRGKMLSHRKLKFATWKLEVIWTLIPLFMLLCLFGWAATIYYDEERPPARTLEAFVVAKQWMWKIQHAEGNREINELHVPTGQAVKLTMTSEDVIHSFYIPAMRLKQDVVPGRYVTEWFEPTRPGTYHLFCAEFCGADHSLMGGNIVVMKPADYQAWLNAGRPVDNLAATGEHLFREFGCSGCHQNSTVVHAPRLEGVFGKPVPLQGGAITTADEQYIRDSILLPASQIAVGYSNVMPSYTGRVSEEQLIQLIAYIKSLGNQTPPEETK
ncbi:MAG TPA: cytochrome c oxidase subunit II [Verrucomicrobiae bacterium]|jgi:cytochrome c oxidase subunit 2|nr:cytochrome c oxidase subunit II [Verrucomicrobiae bacterium]